MNAILREQNRASWPGFPRPQHCREMMLLHSAAEFAVTDVFSVVAAVSAAPGRNAGDMSTGKVRFQVFPGV
jgi:hypothetical protein